MSGPFGSWYKHSSSTTYGSRLWMAGDLEQAKQVLREYCSENGACFSITPYHYIYTGGEEAGFCITIINYPRFPMEPMDIHGRLKEVAKILMEKLNQGSYTIEQYGAISEPQTEFYTRRKQD